MFEQDFSVDAVRAVTLAPDDPPAAALRVVSRLVEKSMVTARPDAEDPPAVPAAGYPPVRSHGNGSSTQERRPRVRDHHLGYYLDLAEKAYSQHTATGSTEPIRELAASAHEMRAALAWASAVDPVAKLRLAGALHPYWRAFAMQEGVDRLLEALEHAGPPTPHRARALLSAGTLAGHLHDAERARSLLHESIAVATRLNDRASAAWAELELGSAAWLSMRVEEGGRTAAGVEHLGDGRASQCLRK